jgi:hypothetical protein
MDQYYFRLTGFEIGELENKFGEEGETIKPGLPF